MLRGCPADSAGKRSWLDEKVVPPWRTEVRISRERAFHELRSANPLCEHLGECSKEGFYAIMVERELVRIRRHELEWPQEWWSAHWVFQLVRLTNVKRSEDRSSIVVRIEFPRLGDSMQHFKVGDVQGTGATVKFSLPWSREERDAVGRLIFNVALCRFFGTPIAIRAIAALNVQAWDHSAHMEVARALAQAALQHLEKLKSKVGGVGEQDEFCFTRAYAPARLHVDEERKFLMHQDFERLRDLYRTECTGAIAGLFNVRVRLADAAQNGPRALTEAIMKVSGYGGTGFIAKEVVEDVKMIGILSAPGIPADSDWAVSGPGARRGCNRLKGRSLSYGLRLPRFDRKVQEKARQEFLGEMQELWEARKDLWPTKDSQGDVPASRVDVAALLDRGMESTLDCNDIQFQLCEADKYFRASEARGARDRVLEFLERKHLRMFSPSSEPLP